MKTQNEVGFTIIETMLFLGITGLLVMGILTGTGVSINIQRYRDSVTSLQATLQQQFSDVSNVSNDSTGSLTCYGDNSVNARGQSDCILLGRFITTADDGHTLSIKNVIGYIGPSVSMAKNDVEALTQFNIRVPSAKEQAPQKYTIEWGASLTTAKGSSASFSMLILRSPISGVTRTFIDSANTISDAKIADLLLVSSSALTQPVNVCINSNGLFTGGRSSVVVNANATGAGAVETRGEATSGC